MTIVPLPVILLTFGLLLLALPRMNHKMAFRKPSQGFEQSMVLHAPRLGHLWKMQSIYGRRKKNPKDLSRASHCDCESRLLTQVSR